MEIETNGAFCRGRGVDFIEEFMKEPQLGMAVNKENDESRGLRTNSFSKFPFSVVATLLWWRHSVQFTFGTAEDSHVNGLVKVNDNVLLRFSAILSRSLETRGRTTIRSERAASEIIVADVELISAHVPSCAAEDWISVLFSVRDFSSRLVRRD